MCALDKNPLFYIPLVLLESYQFLGSLAGNLRICEYMTLYFQIHALKKPIVSYCFDFERDPILRVALRV